MPVPLPSRAALRAALSLLFLGGCGRAPTAPGEPPAEAPLAAIRVAGAAGAGAIPPVGPADTLQLVAVDAAGAPVAASWSSSDPAVVGVSADGRVFAVAPGSATVFASRSGRQVGAPVSSGPAAPAAGSPTTILPGEDIQAKIDAQPAGTRFLLGAGVHRLQTVRPRDGTRLVGEPGAVLSGARLLTAFVRQGAYWVATGQTQEGALAGRCAAETPLCRQPEDLFLDGRRLTPVASLAEVRSGSWHFDRAADRLYLADDPAGRTVEVGVLPHAFTGSATGVLIQGIVVEKYATPAQMGAIHGDRTTNWTLDGVEVRHNHGTGIRLGSGMKVLRSRVHSNGQLGIGGAGAGILVEDTEIAYNNAAGFDPGWEAGGTKFARTQDLVVRGNRVHHNAGHGLWTDIDNVGTLYEGNRVEDNGLSGIFHEISYRAVIRNNTLLRNGRGSPGWVDGAGILVNSSRDVEIHGNTVDGNANGIAAVQSARGTGKYGEYRLTNLYVHDNTVVMAEGRTGIVQDEGSAAVFQDPSNRFQRNRYTITSGTAPFAWGDRRLSFSAWQGAKQDVDGSAAYR